MYTHTIRNTLIAATVGTFVATGLTGCATQQGNQQAMGAGIGCVGGAIIGGLIAGRSGAAIGCAGGAAIGFAGVTLAQYQAEQTRSQQADANRYRKVDPDFYGLSQSATATSVKIRTTGTSPSSIRAGRLITATTDYSIITPRNSTSVMVNESWVLKKDGEVITELHSEPQTRTSGGWSTQAEFDVPQDAPAGTYVIEHKVQAGNSYNSGISVFVVS